MTTGLKSKSISAVNQYISSVKTSSSSETSHLRNILIFLCAVLHHYDYIKVMELAQANLILYSLKITHTPKLGLSRVMSYFCSF